MPFKKGDKVVAVERSNSIHRLEVGKTYVVEEYQGVEQGSPVGVLNEGVIRFYQERRFKLAVEPVAIAAAPAAKKLGVFAVGDKVRVKVGEGKLAQHPNQKMRLLDGSIHTVNRVGEKDGDETLVYLTRDTWEGGGLFARRFEHYIEPVGAKPEALKLEAGCTVACIDAKDSDVLVLRRRYVVEKIYANGAIKLLHSGTRYHPRRFKVVEAPAFPAGPVAPAPKQRKPPKPPKPSTDLREDLYNKAKDGHGQCSYAIEYENGHRSFHANDVCHARLNTAYYGSGQGEVANVAYCLRQEITAFVPRDATKAAHKAYCDYVINRSPWAHAFLTKDIEEAYTKDILMNVEVNKNIMAGACLMLRTGTERKGRANLFKLLIDHGHLPNTAWLVSCAFKKVEGNHYSFFDWSGGHDVIDKYRSFEDTIQFLKTGFHRPSGLIREPYRTSSGNYVIADTVARSQQGASISTWLEKNTVKKVVGEGFNKNTHITEESIYEVADKIDALLKA